MNAENSIELFSTLTYVSAAIAILGLGLAVFFFFYFKIPTVFAFMTGRARKEMIEAMSKENAKSGKLRNAHMVGHTGPTGTTGEMGRTGPVGRIGNTGNLRKAGGTVNPALAETEPIGKPEQAMETTVLRGSGEDLQTTVLTQPVPQPEHRSDETTLLTRNVPQIRFDMTENTILIHTDEII